MKKLITASTALAFITTTAHAGWFGPSQEVIDLRNQVVQQQNTTHFWSIAAGVLVLLVILAFIIGTMLGSRVRRHAQKSASGE